MEPGVAKQVLDAFRVPGYQDRLFVLGSFARYLTVYSQQVRAFNLVAALLANSVIDKRSRVAVIGGGVAGVTAAAALAHHGVPVVLLEELEGLLELQYNNRQRWIHPHIYDWPEEEYKSESSARLPLLNWEAGYAEAVAGKIETAWKSLAESNPGITVKYNVHDVSIPPPRARAPKSDSLKITWNDEDGPHPDQQFNAVILAVGFGLEKETSYSKSYWSEDDVDGGFRRSETKERWLVSGSGDGALTDLMRLCLRRFRHAEIRTFFAKADSYPGVQVDLKVIHSRRPEGLDPEWVSKQFEQLSAPGFEAILKQRLRRHGPVVYLASRGPLYGMGSSVLNRLVVLILARLNAFTLLVGDTKVRSRGKRFKVTVDGAPIQPDFDRVLLRHGPDPKLQACFPNVWKATEAMRAHWKMLPRDQDITRKRQWINGYFGPENRGAASVAGDSQSRFGQAIEKIGVQAKGLFVTKELRNDGSSTILYTFDELKVTKGELQGIHFYYESSTGSVALAGLPALDAASERMGHYWAEDPGDKPRANMLSGVLRFKKPLTPADKPATFGIAVHVLNGEALSTWEFRQMYEAGSLNIDMSPVADPIEYLARTVWFPLEKLTIRISLPDRSPGPASAALFVVPGADGIAREDVVRDSILQIYPHRESKFAPTRVQWSRVSDFKAETDRSANTWELTVGNPQVGACYSLEWPVAKSPESSRLAELEMKVSRSRECFLRHAQQHRTPGQPAKESVLIREWFLGLYAHLSTVYALKDSPETFEVTLMSYDAETRRLVLFEGRVNGKEPTEQTWSFSLPFGLGMAGACFKQGDRAIAYFKPKEKAETTEEGAGARPDYYLSLPGNRQHEVLISLPIDFAGFNGDQVPADFERGRQCVAIINIGSYSDRSPLLDFMNDADGAKFSALRNRCQGSFNELYEKLQRLLK